MSYSLKIPPAVEPVSLADAKDWLKIDGPDEDKIISALITSARLAVEAATGLMLITQTWRLSLDAWPQSGTLLLTHAPLQDVESFWFPDQNGNLQIVPLTNLNINAGGREPKLTLRGNVLLPLQNQSAMALDLRFGYGDTADKIPEPLKLVIKMLVALWHENRGDDGASASLRWPEQVTALLQPFILRRL